MCCSLYCSACLRHDAERRADGASLPSQKLAGGLPDMRLGFLFTGAFFENNDYNAALAARITVCLACCRPNGYA